MAGDIARECCCIEFPAGLNQACCFLESGCLDITLSDCIEAQGLPQGPGTLCSQVNCPEILEDCEGCLTLCTDSPIELNFLNMRMRTPACDIFGNVVDVGTCIFSCVVTPLEGEFCVYGEVLDTSQQVFVSSSCTSENPDNTWQAFATEPIFVDASIACRGITFLDSGITIAAWTMTMAWFMLCFAGDKGDCGSFFGGNCLVHYWRPAQKGDLCPPLGVMYPGTTRATIFGLGGCPIIPNPGGNQCVMTMEQPGFMIPTLI